MVGQQERAVVAEYGLSMALSGLLRHWAKDEGVPINEEGWVALEDALAYANREGDQYTEEDARHVVVLNDKQRFSMRLDPSAPVANKRWQIRCNQGHTIEGIHVDLEPLNLNMMTEPFALHGSYLDLWDSIRTIGLQRMQRMHIHMAAGLPSEKGVISGMRNDCDLYIWIDLKKAIAAGMRFFISSNNVILTEGINGAIPATYFHRVTTNDGREISMKDSHGSAPVHMTLRKNPLRSPAALSQSSFSSARNAINIEWEEVLCEEGASLERSSYV